MKKENFVDLVHSYERSGASKADACKQAASERPDLYEEYDLQVRGRPKNSLAVTSSRLAEQVRTYMHETGEPDYTTAVKHIINQARPPEKVTKRFSPTERLKALVAPLLAKGDMKGAITVASRAGRLAIDAAAEWLVDESRRLATFSESEPSNAESQSQSLRDVIKNNPEIAEIWGGGRLSVRALKKMFASG